MAERLFDRGELGEESATADSSPLEHSALPRATERASGPPTVVFSFDSEEERDALIAELGLAVTGPHRMLTGYWPVGSERNADQLGFEC